MAPGTLLASGELTQEATDLSVKSRGFDFSFTRTYRSQTVGAGPLGPGWDFGYDQRLRELPDGDVEYYGGGGRQRERVPPVFQRTRRAPKPTWTSTPRACSTLGSSLSTG